MKLEDRLMLSKTRFLMILVLTLELFFLSACTSSQKKYNKTTPTLPIWITTPHVDTNDYMYGLAIEKDRHVAIEAALVNMVSKLGIEIESSFESNQEVSNYYNKQISTHNIKSNVEKIKINNYELVKSKRINYKEFAVLIRTDKKKFYSALVRELDEKQENMKLRLKSLKEEDILTRYKIKKELMIEAQNQKSKILVTSQLDETFNARKYFDFIVMLKKEFLKEKKALSFYVQGDKSSFDFIQEIKNYLLQKGFKLSTKIYLNTIIINVNTTQYIQKNSYMDIAVLKVKMDIFNATKKIGGKSIILKERFDGEILSAYKNASIHFRKDIKELGINSSVF